MDIVNEKENVIVNKFQFYMHVVTVTCELHMFDSTIKITIINSMQFHKQLIKKNTFILI